jgi:hypothetical protein
MMSLPGWCARVNVMGVQRQGDRLREGWAITLPLSTQGGDLGAALG